MIEPIKELVSLETGVDIEEIEDTSRRRAEATRARRLIWGVMTAYNQGVRHISSICGCDHTSVINGLKQLTDEDREVIQRIKTMLSEQGWLEDAPDGDFNEWLWEKAESKLTGNGDIARVPVQYRFFNAVCHFIGYEHNMNHYWKRDFMEVV